MRNSMKVGLTLALLAVPVGALSFMGPSRDNEGATALGTMEKYEEREGERAADEFATLQSRPDPNEHLGTAEKREMYSRSTSTDTSKNTSKAGQEDDEL